MAVTYVVFVFVDDDDAVVVVVVVVVVAIAIAVFVVVVIGGKFSKMITIVRNQPTHRLAPHSRIH